jgi:phosphohistidine phosphatase SixA
MKHLFLLRHAKSSWDDPTLADHDRPLAPRDRRAAKVMAEHLRRKGIAPELVLCSRVGPEILRLRSKFPTAALATLELNGTWRELAPGSAELVSFVKPKEVSRGAAAGA